MALLRRPFPKRVTSGPEVDVPEPLSVLGSRRVRMVVEMTDLNAEGPKRLQSRLQRFLDVAPALKGRKVQVLSLSAIVGHAVKEDRKKRYPLTWPFRMGGLDKISRPGLDPD